jgi:hypothetical protein
VKQPLKSVVRQIRTLRSVGAGGGQLPPATRWAIREDRPYRVTLAEPGTNGALELYRAGQRQKLF